MAALGVVDGGGEAMEGVEVDAECAVGAEAAGVFGAEEEHARAVVDGVLEVGGDDAEIGVAEERDEVVTLPKGRAEAEVR